MFTWSYEDSFIIVIYVDDMVFMRTDFLVIKILMKFLHDRFTIIDLGKLKYFLRIKVTHFKQGISIS